MKKITVISGDGIGPEITKEVLNIFEALKIPLEYDFQEAGEVALKNHGELLPAKTLASIEKNQIGLKGPLMTPVGFGYRSLNVELRQKYDLFANVRPIQSLPGVRCLYPDINLVIVRENTEDLYTGDEHMESPDIAISIKKITKKGSQRIHEFAFDLARKLNINKIACAHKANIMKLTDGLFLNVFRDVAKSHGNIESRDIIIDNCSMQLVMNPKQFEMIVTQNLYGDILSDLCAGLVGGLGVVPSANIGTHISLFEAVHGSAPDIAGKGLANPTALLLSSIMMLQYLDLNEFADKILNALKKTLLISNVRTPDLGGTGTTQSFAKSIIENL